MQMNRLRRAATVAASLVLAAGILRPAAAAAQPDAVPRPVVIDDLMQLRSIGSIDVSADGRQIVYTVRGAAWGELAPGESPNASTPTITVEHLWHLRITEDGPGTPRRLVAGDDRVGGPAFSPDGRHIAFVRAGDVADGWDGLPATGPDADAGAPTTSGRAAQIWVQAVDGGEAVQVSWFRFGAGSPQWSPDGTQLLVTAGVPLEAITGTPPWTDDRPGAEAWRELGEGEDDAATPAGTRRDLRRWMQARAERTDPRVITRLDFQGERGLAGAPGRSRSAVLTLAPHVLGRGTAPLDGARPAATVRWAARGFDDVRGARWLPGGTRQVFVAPSDPRQHPDRVARRILATSSLDGLDVQPLVDLEDWTVDRPRPAADGRIAFAARRIDQPSDRQWRIGLIDPAEVEGPVRDETRVRWLTDEESFDYSVGAMQWHGGRVLFSAPVRGGFPLLTVSPGLLAPAALVQERDGFPVGVHGFAAAGETLAWCETHPTNPAVLRVRTGDREFLAHDLNPWVAERTLSLPRKGVVTRPRGLEVDYWVMEPVGLRPREKAPLVLQIHGGPSAMWGPGEASMWHEFQVLCGWGYGVVYANPRGSGGYGYDFQRANFQDWGQGPAGDVLAALDEATALDWVDRESLVLTGGSYGGYLVAWIVGNDNRFAAAVAQRGVYHLATFYGEGNAWRLLEWEMGGKPWEARMDPVLRRESPFTYVMNMRTPLLIMHADRDLRTGVSQSEMLYRALRDLGRPVEYVRYPEAGHDLSRTGDPGRRMDRIARIVEFFERFSRNRRSAPRSGD
jgi:dipeptidyl aminopeptidase/acylaminoacyl peptidase